MQDQNLLNESNLPPIDEELTICLYENQATNQQLQCLSTAYSQWDVELNKIYNELLQLLDTGGQQVLTDAQLEWIKYRDAEFELVRVIYPSANGKMNLLFAAFRKQEIVKTRVLELNGYLQSVQAVS